MNIIGHRGARGLAPENTLKAIEAGIDAGVDELEIDVRVTSDGVPVLHHDPMLRDENGRKIPGTNIVDHTLGELRAYKADLATLEEAINAVVCRVPMMIELKPGISTHEVVDVLQNFLQKSWRPTDFSLASFSQRTLRSMHKALPDIPLVIIERFSGLRAIWRARELNTYRITMNRHNLWGWFIRGMHKAGFELNAYTLNDPDKAKRWASRGLYGAITDYPNRFKRKPRK